MHIYMFVLEFAVDENPIITWLSSVWCLCKSAIAVLNYEQLSLV